MKQCLDCSDDISARPPQTKRCKSCKRLSDIKASKAFRVRNPDYEKDALSRTKESLTNRASNEKLKFEVICHYSNGVCACVKCGFSDIRALQIDHINGGGATQYKEISRYSHKSLYRWLRMNNYPTGYQTLCANCNWIKRHENKEWGNTKNRGRRPKGLE